MDALVKEAPEGAVKELIARLEQRQAYLTATKLEATKLKAEVGLEDEIRTANQKVVKFMFQRGREDALGIAQQLLDWMKEDLKELSSFLEKDGGE